MYQHFRTRKQLVLRIAAYFFMFLAVLIGLTAATAWILGYRLDVKEQEVDRITLLQFGSFPAGAKIAVNDKEMNFTTPGRYDESKPGVSSAKFWLEGYRDWTKTVNLKAAEVRWLNYARLVPREIVSSDLQSMAGYHQAVAAPSGDFILLRELPDGNNFKLIDISDPKNVKTSDLALPDEVLPAGGVENCRIIEWDTSSNFVLLELSFGGIPEIVRLDRREVTRSQNLTKLFSVDIANPHFQGGDNNLVFGLTGTDLRRFDVAGKTTSAPLVKGVEKYDLYGDGKLAYVATRDGQQSAGVFYREKDHILREFTESLPTLVSFTHYYRSDYLAIARGEQIEIVARPLDDGSDETATLETPGGVDFLTHNGSGRILLAGRAGQVFSYDLETAESFQFDSEDFGTKPFWLDDYHLGYTSGGQLKMMEFDGANRETLVAATGFGLFSGNNEHLFTFVAREDGVHLQSSAMLVTK
jgi:hypothetical protein